MRNQKIIIWLKPFRRGRIFNPDEHLQLNVRDSTVKLKIGDVDCGGSLIRSPGDVTGTSYVLSAAHCFDDIQQ